MTTKEQLNNNYRLCADDKRAASLKVNNRLSVITDALSEVYNDDFDYEFANMLANILKVSNDEYHRALLIIETKMKKIKEELLKEEKK